MFQVVNIYSFDSFDCVNDRKSMLTSNLDFIASFRNVAKWLLVQAVILFLSDLAKQLSAPLCDFVQ